MFKCEQDYQYASSYEEAIFNSFGTYAEPYSYTIEQPGDKLLQEKNKGLKRLVPEGSDARKNSYPTNQESEPDTIKYGPWSEEEHNKFLQALELYGNQWGKVQAYIKTRSATQIRSHAQKYFERKRTKALKAIKKSGNKKRLVFLVTREYHNLSHIIQKRPMEVYLDPDITTQEWRKKARLEAKQVKNETAALPAIKSLAWLAWKAGAKDKKELEGNMFVPVDESGQVGKHNEYEDSQKNKEWDNLFLSESFSGVIFDHNEDSSMDNGDGELVGFLSKINYEP